MHLRPTAAALLLLASLTAAQTTHLVNNGPSFAFSPSALTVQVGDTVTWVWKGGLHTVDSGSGGLPNGIFSSGTPTGTVGFTFSVTFDHAFIASHPVPNNVYPYMCLIHSTLGQNGTITVVQTPTVTTYGCLNPAGSLTTASGAPQVGTTWTVAADNPLATQSPGSLAFLAVASSAAPGYPCGVSLPGFGMAATGAVGELLVDLSPPNPLVNAGPVPWLGSPASFPLPIPSLSTLVGAQVFAQGLVVDLAPDARVLFGATEGLAATIGS